MGRLASAVTTSPKGIPQYHLADSPGDSPVHGERLVQRLQEKLKFLFSLVILFLADALFHDQQSTRQKPKS